jgi:hypothetical protein
MHSSPASKGQGAAEYLLLIVAVLGMTLIVISLLGFFPAQAGDAQRAESDVYWGQVSRPFAIAGHQENSTGHLTLLLQNLDPEPRTITNISVASVALNGSFAPAVNGSLSPDSSTRFFQPGENKTITVPLSVGGAPVDGAHPGCASGRRYEYYVNITYSNADFSLSGVKEIGLKTLIGLCS